MPEIILNAAGFTRTTGTANPTITGDTGKSGSFSDIATGTEVAYYRRYSSNKAGFENGIGIWREVSAAGSIGYIERTSVELSSNPGDDGYDPVVWGVGEQIIDVTITPDMIVADDDPRLDTVPTPDMDAATTVDGTELIPADQAGDGVSLTVQQIAGNPIRAQLGHGKTINKSFSNFTKLNKGFSVGDGSVGVAAGLEPFLCYASGAGSGCLNLQVFFNVTAMSLNTGTTTTGRVCLEHLEYPITYDPVTYDRDYRQNILTGVMPVAGNEATWQFGFNNVAPEIATLGTGLGVFFELKATDTNWQAAFISASAGAANYRRVDTGVAAVTGTSYVFRVHLRSHPTDSAERKADFYINGDLVASIPNVETGVAAIPTSTKLSMVAVAQKTAGTTGSSCIVTEHYSEIERPALRTGLDV